MRQIGTMNDVFHELVESTMFKLSRLQTLSKNRQEMEIAKAGHFQVRRGPWRCLGINIPLLLSAFPTSFPALTPPFAESYT